MSATMEEAAVVKEGLHRDLDASQGTEFYLSGGRGVESSRGLTMWREG